jgi:hypothetical protein
MPKVLHTADPDREVSMTDGPVTPPPVSGAPKSIIDRARDILLKPKDEWAVIDREPATVQGIFTSYVLILAAIPAIALALGLFLFVPRGTVYGVSYGISTGGIVAAAVVQYVLGVASVYIIGLIIDALAPSFGSTKDPLKALKVAAYYPTAYWLASALMIVPILGGLVALVGGIYSLYLLYIGLPALMKTPQDKQVGYFVVTLIVAAVVIVIVSQIAGRIVYAGLI